MRNNLIVIVISAIIFLFSMEMAYSQETGRRYTFVAKDGSQIINVLLVNEKEDSYTVKIGSGNQEILIEKKNIEKLVMTDAEKKIDYKPVIGKKSEPKTVVVQKESGEGKKSDQESDFYKISLALTAHKISTLGGDGIIDAQGWGGEVLPMVTFRQLDFLQLGPGFSYSRIDSTVQEKVSNLTMACIFGYLQLSHAPGFLSYDFLTVRPFLGAAFGGALSYSYSKPTVINSGSGNEAGNTSATGIKNFSMDPFYGLRAGIGLSSLKNIPLEILLSFQYSVIPDSKIKNFMLFSAGVNIRF